VNTLVEQGAVLTQVIPLAHAVLCMNCEPTVVYDQRNRCCPQCGSAAQFPVARRMNDGGRRAGVGAAVAAGGLAHGVRG
jgi:predicted amidophosphoribosyltransferase